MSWNGTVTCGHCGDEGHNKRTCHEWRYTLESRAANGSHYAQRQLDKLNSNSKSNRKCGWCGEKGHNKRTCRHPKEAKIVAPLVGEEITKLLKKVVGELGRGTILDSRYNTNCVALRVGGTVTFGKSRLCKKTVEQNRSNTKWLTDVLLAFTASTHLHCITPKGTKVVMVLPVIEAKLHDTTIHVGIPSSQVKVVSPAPIECKVNVEISKGATAESLKGWIAVTKLLLDKVTFEKC